MITLLLASLLSAPVCNPSQLSFTASGGVQRAVCDKLSDVVSVQDKCGSSVLVDYSTCIGGLLTSLSGGGGVYVPCGTYPSSTALTVPTGVRVYGAGKLCSAIQFTGATSGLTFAAGAHDFAVEHLTLTTTNAGASKALDMSAGSTGGSGYSYFTIRDVAILASGSGRWATGIDARFAESANVTGLKIFQSATIGVYLADSSNQLQFFNLEITGGGAADATYNRGVWVDANPSGTGAPEFFGVTSQGCFSLGAAVYVTGHHPKFYGLHAEGNCGVTADGGDVVVNGTSDVGLFGGHIVGNLVVEGTVRGFLAEGFETIGAVTFASTVQGAFILNSRAASITDSGTVGSPTNNGNGWINVRSTAGGAYRNKGMVEFDAPGAGSASSVASTANTSASYANGTTINWRQSGGTDTPIVQLTAANQTIFQFPSGGSGMLFRSDTPTTKMLLGNTALTMSVPITMSSTTGGGTITLSAGSGTATVLSGARCVCTDQTANASVKCSVSTTTLTATGTGTDVIAYLCF